MKLGDRIQLRIETKSLNGDLKVVEDEFVVIGVSYGMAHCFGDSMWSYGFNSFEYGKHEDGRPDIVRKGSIYVPVPEYLEKPVMKEMHHDNKTVSWEIL